MHECPECGQACDCDLEDIWWDDFPNCTHNCEPEEENDGGYSACLDDKQEVFHCTQCSRLFLSSEGTLKYDDEIELFVCDECAAQPCVQLTGATGADASGAETPAPATDA